MWKWNWSEDHLLMKGTTVEMSIKCGENALEMRFVLWNTIMLVGY